MVGAAVVGVVEAVAGVVIGVVEIAAVVGAEQEWHSRQNSGLEIPCDAFDLIDVGLIVGLLRLVESFVEEN